MAVLGMQELETPKNVVISTMITSKLMKCAVLVVAENKSTKLLLIGLMKMLAIESKKRTKESITQM